MLATRSSGQLLLEPDPPSCIPRPSVLACMHVLSVCVISKDGGWCEAPQASLERATTEVDWLARGGGYRRIAQRKLVYSFAFVGQSEASRSQC